MGEARKDALRLDFDRKLKLEFHGTKVTSDAGLLAYRELDEALGLTSAIDSELRDNRTGKNKRHSISALLRQSIYSRLAGYDDTNDAERLCVDPAMRHVAGGRAIERSAASTSLMGRFETEILTQSENLGLLMDLPGVWVDKVHQRKLLKQIILDMNSSVSPTYGNQEGSVYNGTLSVLAIILCSASTNLAIWSEPSFVMVMSIVPMTGEIYWSRLSIVIEIMTSSDSFAAMLPLLNPRCIAILRQRGIFMRYV